MPDGDPPALRLTLSPSLVFGVVGVLTTAIATTWSLSSRLTQLEGSGATMQVQLADLRAEVRGQRTDIDGLRISNATVASDLAAIRDLLQRIDRRFDQEQKERRP